MKTKKEEYIDKVTNELKEWSAKIDELEARVSTASADAKTGYENRIRDLKEKREVLTRKLGELKESSEDAWEALKTGVDKAWVDLKGTIATVRDKFKKAA